jgi:hypothetical protein
VPNKCHHHRPIKLKKPKVTPGIASVAPKKPEVSPIATCVAKAILKKLDQVEEDAMTEVEPSISADPLIIPYFTSPSPLHKSSSAKASLIGCPFPHEFDHMKIEKWLSAAKT